jgi:hypothetical protein
VIADRHYSRQKPGTPQFVPPGRCLVLVATEGVAYWVSTWPFAEYVKHRWAGAWGCSAFRRESGPLLASEMIRHAVACTCWKWPDVPELGMVTFIDRDKVKPVKRRGELIWGYSYMQAGFEPVGDTEGGLLALQLPPERMPPPMEPACVAAQGKLFT